MKFDNFKSRYSLIALGVLLVLAISLASFMIVNANKNDRSISQTTATQKVINGFDKIYVAAEGAGQIDVISESDRKVVKTISLSPSETSSKTMYMAHNVQVAPDNKTVWVTANAMVAETEHGGDHSFLRQMLPIANASPSSDDADQVIVIDPTKDEIVKRINVGNGLHLAHVVLTPDGRYAISAAQEKGELYKIDASSYQIVETIKTQPGAQPHGLRMTPDGNYAYVAMLEGKSIGKLDLAASTIDYIPLSGKPVQTAVTPDGRYVAASVFDSKSVAVFDTNKQNLSYIELPKDAKGPVQLYPTPDSKFIYVADQGNYFGQPDSDKLYKIDIKNSKVVQEITAGTAPHGVVVSPDGKRTYVTNLVSNDVSVVDNDTGKEVARIPVGKKPNGISYWTKQ